MRRDLARKVVNECRRGLHGTTKSVSLLTAVILNVILQGVVAFAQEVDRTELLAGLTREPVIKLLSCPDFSTVTECNALVRELVFSKSADEVSPTHIAADTTDVTLRALMRNCDLEGDTSSFGVADSMYWPTPIAPRGPFELFDLPTSQSVSDSSLVIAKGYYRPGAQSDLDWIGYFLVERRSPCSPELIDRVQSEGLQHVESVIQQTSQEYLITILEQDKSRTYYTGRINTLVPWKRGNLIGFSLNY